MPDAGSAFAEDLTMLSAAGAGLVAGLIGSFVMDRAQALWPAPDVGGGAPATVVAANRAHQAVTGRPVLRTQRAVAGSLVHYLLGGMLGAAYGAAAERWPVATRGGGVPFGVATALILDEALVPAAGLTRPPWRYSAGVHAYGLISHAIFGASVEAVRRLLHGRPVIQFGKPTTSRSVAGQVAPTSPQGE